MHRNPVSDRGFASRVHEVADALQANERYQENGWTDGLPIAPPTEEAVGRFLAVASVAPDHVVGTEPVRRRRITAEKVAIAAVMAGGLPEYLPVVLAVVTAMCQPEFRLHGSTASTGGSAPFIVVNGPVRTELGMNSTHNALANASRANATIGRAIRLMILNVLGGIPGELDRSTLGHPGKFTYCVAEDEEDSPWPSLAAERGVPAGTSAVTVLGASSSHQIMNEWTHDPREILDTYAACIRANMLTYSIWPGNYVIVEPKQHREIFAAANWSKRDDPGVRARAGARTARRVADGGEGRHRRTQGREPRLHRAALAGRPADRRGRRPGGGIRRGHTPWNGSKGVAVTMPVRRPPAAG